jgi:hypothetical protein
MENLIPALPMSFNRAPREFPASEPFEPDVSKNKKQGLTPIV